MTEQERCVINLIKAAIVGEGAAVSVDNEAALLRLASMHQIHSLLCYGILESKTVVSADCLEKLQTETIKNAALDERQRYDYETIASSFEAEGIEYLPLKGIELKRLYPKSEMRPMSDIDILIRTEQYKKAAKVMSALGYTEEVESDHEWIWNKTDATAIELHRRLIPSYNKDFYASFGEGWQLAVQSDNNKYRYHLEVNENFYYLFTHFAKHYRDGGIGIRHITDLWVYMLKTPSLDKEKVRQMLTEVKLDQFFDNTLKTIAVWFDDAPSDEVADAITRHILLSGSYGKTENKALSAAVKSEISAGTAKGTRFRMLWNTVFLPYKHMCKKYPSLKKCPILLPLFWFVRIIDVLLHKPDAIKKKQNEFKNITSQNIEDYHNSLKLVGLDYNFKE
ncbi:MAG: nucleotidyltransferase family protein [Clostridia bacterium]|nr:nucleotidyltransferase family protein [Clostridia bacterium]